MYVFKAKDLPKDPVFPSDLKALGYFVNGNGQVRQIDYPAEGFRWKVNRNDRYNLVHEEAMSITIREIVNTRLQELGLTTLRLPLGAAADAAHVPILTSEDIAKKRRIVIVLGSSQQDLGIWSSRAIHEDGIKTGSVVEFAKAVLEKPGAENETALIIANPGQLTWYCQGQKAMTTKSFEAQPRTFACSEMPAQTWRNKIPGNTHYQEHINYVFENVLKPNLASKSRIDVLAVSEGGHATINYLRDNWEFWKKYLSGVCLADPYHTAAYDLDREKLTDKDSFTAFFSSRGRAYTLSSDPVGTMQPGYRDYGCNCYASGEELNSDSIAAKAWIDMLVWFDKLQEDPLYAENVTILADDMDENTLKKLEESVVEDEADRHVASPWDGNSPVDSSDEGHGKGRRKRKSVQAAGLKNGNGEQHTQGQTADDEKHEKKHEA